MTDLYHPLCSLQEGDWFKLICGASFQHLPAVRNLTLAYALAGADCIDVAADPAVIAAARDALQVAEGWLEEARSRGFQTTLPWLMVSLNDGEDPHFRKASFDPTQCPADCPRPCETICPAQAILFDRPSDGFSGVLDDRCYGCGRCLPICPIQQISARAYVSTPATIAPLVLAGVDAVEIHTQVGRLEDFRRLWQAIVPFLPHLKLVAISCPDGTDLIDYLWALHDLIAPLPCALLWQTDGRPMSGDIGTGATRAAVKLGQKVLAAGLPGYVQLAGGTNHHTVAKLRSLNLLRQAAGSTDPSSPHVAGVAYGSYARGLLAPVLQQLEQREQAAPVALQSSIASVLSSSDLSGSDRSDLDETGSPAGRQPAAIVPFPVHLEEVPELLWQAVRLADSLVSQLKPPIRLRQSTVNLS